MSELLDAYLADPETWNRFAKAIIRSVVRRLVDAAFKWLERRSRRRTPRHRDDK